MFDTFASFVRIFETKSNVTLADVAFCCPRCIHCALLAMGGASC